MRFPKFLPFLVVGAVALSGTAATAAPTPSAGSLGNTVAQTSPAAPAEQTPASGPAKITGEVTPESVKSASHQLGIGQSKEIGTINGMAVSVVKRADGRTALTVTPPTQARTTGDGQFKPAGWLDDGCYWGLWAAIAGLGAAGIAALIWAAGPEAAAITIAGIDIEIAVTEAIKQALSVGAAINGFIQTICFA